jgi:integrase
MMTLTAEQSAALLASVRHMRLYWPTLIALATGLRRGEILALRWGSVDLERRTLQVTGSLEQTKAGIRFKPPKTGRTRAVTLPVYAAEELRRLRLLQAQELLKVGIRHSDQTLVCCRADGEPLMPDSLTHEFARLDFKPRVRFHDLRHSHATQLLASGVHPKVALERLGHSTITTTLDLYSHVSETMQVDAADRLDAAWQAVKRK